MYKNPFPSISKSSLAKTFEGSACTDAGPMLAYAILLDVFAIAFMVWIIVISVKAIKIVNGFDMGKAFGLLILVMIIASAASVVFNV